MNIQPTIGIVLLNYNGKALLQKNLPSLIRTTYPNKLIAVIDNCSTDESLPFLRQNYPDVQIITLSENKGYAGGYNEGLCKIDAKYFILLNTDVEVTEGFIEPLLSAMETDRNVGICQPKILSLEKPQMFEYAGAAGGYMDNLGYTFARGRILNVSEVDNGQYNKPGEIFWASGACFMIRASLFRELAGFYEYYFMYSEEIDLCWRAQLAGRKIWYCPSSVIYHKETIDFRKQSSQRIYYVFRNNLIMLLRNLAFSDKLLVFPVRIGLNIIASLMFLFKGKLTKSMIVLRSLIAVFYWLLFAKNNKVVNKKSINRLRCVYKKAILIEYYLSGKKKYSELDQSKF